MYVYMQICIYVNVSRTTHEKQDFHNLAPHDYPLSLSLYIYIYMVGGFKHVFFHTLGIIIPSD